MRFTEAQQAAIVAMRPLACVSAGAGSGKTAILVERIAHLLASPELWPDRQPHLERIAAITFTEKAAAEMKARLRKKFREKPALDDPKSMHFWREQERQVDSARITTIHAFCASLLREHALRIGMDPDWSVLGDAEAAQVAERVVVEVLHRLLESGNPAALRLSINASRTELKDALLHVLHSQWQYADSLDDELYVQPERLLEHWRSLLPQVYKKHLGALVLSWEFKRHQAALDCLENYCADPNDKRELQRRAYAELLTALASGPPDPAGLITEVLGAFPRMGGSKKVWDEDGYQQAGEAIKAAKAFISHKCQPPAWNPEFEERVAQMTCDLHLIARETTTAHAQARQMRGAVDYEDMINETLRLLRNDEALRNKIARSLRFLLIDEFQDTDARQLEAARLLAEAPEGPDLFIVGDVKQSVYYFRGAEVELFNEQLRRDAESVVLADNFRTLPEVLGFINDFFTQSQLLDSVERYQPMRAARPAVNAPRVEIFVPDCADANSKDKAPQLRARDALFTARRIREMCLGPDPLLIEDPVSGQLRPAVYDDIALLFRRGSFMHEYEAALREEQIPYNRIAGAGFFKQREVLDVLAMLKLILDPWDEEALLTALRSPMVGLSDESLLRMTGDGTRLAAAFHGAARPDPFDQTEALDAAHCLFAELYAARESPPGALLRLLLDRTGFEAVLLSGHLGLQKASNLRKVVRMADEFAQGRPSTVSEFTRYLDDVSVREMREGEAMLQSKGMGAVTLMSIHKSKGLEYPIAFVPEMYIGSGAKADGMVLSHPDLGMAAHGPDEEGGMKAGAIGELIKGMRRLSEDAESARILYVAMTRARDYLVLCGHAAPARFSWADALNNVYDLPKRAHGDIIVGENWQARVLRELPPPALQPSIAVAVPSTDAAALADMIAPVAPKPAGNKTISVSKLLSLITGVDSDDQDEDDRMQANEEAISEEGASMGDAPIGGSSLALARGILAHRLFECWNFQHDRVPDLDALICEAHIVLEQRDSMRAQLLRMIDRLRASEYWSLFSSARCIQKETPFLLDIGPVLVHGVVDAVLDQNTLVDYKTGRPNPAWQARYEAQLLLYAAALRDLCGQAPTRGMLWYADYGEAHLLDITESRINAVCDKARQRLSSP